MSRSIEDRANTPIQKAEILDRIEAVWASHPELRLGQLLLDIVGYPEISQPTDLFYVEDYELARRAEKFAELFGRRTHKHGSDGVHEGE